jgi:gas vesicle protein
MRFKRGTLYSLFIFTFLLITMTNPGLTQSAIEPIEAQNSNVTNDSLGKINSGGNSTIKDDPLLGSTLQGTIVGGIIGFVSAILVDLVKDWINRPKISIKEETVEKQFKYNRILSAAKIISDNYIGTRIKVQNTGNRAAENCKATLIIDNDEYRLGWMISKEDMTVIINAHDTEFLDVCAVALLENKWRRIFTTERGYGDNQKDGREFENYDNKTIKVQLKISSKNTKTCYKDIWILSQPADNNKIVAFQYTEPEN